MAENDQARRDSTVRDACVHSMMVDGCYSCLEGHVWRMNRYIERLRAMLVAAGEGDALADPPPVSGLEGENK